MIVDSFPEEWKLKEDYQMSADTQAYLDGGYKGYYWEKIPGCTGMTSMSVHA